MIQTYSVFAKGWCQAPAFLNRVVVTSLTTTHWPLPSANLTDYNEPVILPDENQAKSARVRKNSLKSDTQSRLKLFPNPASDYVIVSYANAPAQAVLTVKDATGRALLTFLLHRSTDQVTLPLTNLAPGTYLMVLTAGNKTLGSQKFTITR
jgi:hypothetical protein